MEFLFFVDSILFNTLGILFVALGVLTSIRFTGYPDLTVDGSFTLGAAIYALTLIQGISPFLALLFAMLGGALGGLLTGFLNRYLHIGKIISSIIVMIFLILIVPYFSDGATVGLLSINNIFSQVAILDKSVTQILFLNANFSFHFIFTGVITIILILISFLLYTFFKSRFGITLRYIGSATEPNLVTQKHQTFYILTGLAIGNALVALGGAIEAERNGGFSQNMGVGIILIGIATVILGESIWKAILKRNNLYLHQQILACISGVLVYSFGIQFILSLNFGFVDIRLLTTGFILILLAYVSSVQSNVRELF